MTVSLRPALLAALVAFFVFPTAEVFSADAALARENWMTRVYRSASPSVVDIRGDKGEATSGGVTDASDGGSGTSSGIGMGTGIVIDSRGYIVTNFHVVDGIRSIQVTTNDRKKYTASLVTRDPETDLAIIKIETQTPLTPIAFGRSGDVLPGEEVIALGNPFGYASTMTNGIVSGVGREVEVNDTLLYRDVIQTNAAINPGNSGGPLVNIDGEMIGINAAIRQGAQCIAFAIPVDQVMDVSAKMIAGIVAERVSLGITVRHDKSGGTNRVVVTTVDRQPSEHDSTAWESNDNQSSIAAGDVVVAIDGAAVRHPLDFYRAFLSSEQGDETSLTVNRNATTCEMTLALSAPQVSERRRNMPVATTTVNAAPTGEVAVARTRIAAKFPTTDTSASTKSDAVWETFGIRVEPIPGLEFQSKYAKFLTLYPYGGVRVTAVRPKSTMAGEGIRVGDVIVGIHEWSVTSNDDLKYIAGEWPNLKQQGSIRVLIIRGDDGHFYRYIPVL
ncbi:MAG: trypsin-like peptidase domain-containing protein [Thermoguttaceae bacterium]